MRRYDPWADKDGGGASGLRAGSIIAAEVAAAAPPGELRGLALEHARSMVSSAVATIERLSEQGWRAVAGETPTGRGGQRGREALAERTESFDPFEPMLGGRGLPR
jgi:hypothetical protein